MMGKSTAPARMQLAVLFVCTLLLTASSALAATLHAGDVVVLGRTPLLSNPQVLFAFNPSTSALQSIAPNPALTDMQDLVIRDNGEILVSDGVQGLVAVNALDGTWQVRFAPVAFGGSAPSALALAPNGDLLAAGMFGVMRLANGGGAPQQVSNAGFASAPQGITCDGGANIWVSSEQLLHVDALSGVASPLTVCCSGYTVPFSTLGTLHRGPDGFLYVVNAPDGGGPSMRANNGVFRIDPTTGESSVFRKGTEILSFAFDGSGTDWICLAGTISHTPYGGFLEGAGTSVNLNNRGPVAIVPPNGTTPARRTTWGALKQRER